jgi:hypothetical protein
MSDYFLQRHNQAAGSCLDVSLMQLSCTRGFTSATCNNSSSKQRLISIHRTQRRAVDRFARTRGRLERLGAPTLTWASVAAPSRSRLLRARAVLHASKHALTPEFMDSFLRPNTHIYNSGRYLCLYAIHLVWLMISCYATVSRGRYPATLLPTVSHLDQRLLIMSRPAHASPFARMASSTCPASWRVPLLSCRRVDSSALPAQNAASLSRH